VYIDLLSPLSLGLALPDGFFALGLAMPSGNGAKMHDLKMNYLNVLSSKEKIK